MWSLLLLLPVFLLSGCSLTKPQEVPYLIDLEIWGIFDDTDAFGTLFEQYRKYNPFVGSTEYKKFTLENYKKDLLDALASGKPPDVFYIQSTWLPQFADKIAPADPKMLGEAEFRNTFVDVASNDCILDGKVYGVPLSVDSLALYYNKDIFNYEGITSPPKTWAEFNADVAKLVQKDSFGRITRAGAAIGTAYNINRSTDLYQALLFQGGSAISGDMGIFLGSAGDRVLEYYTQFSRGNSPVYTWNKDMHYSVDAFAEGNLGMMINYSWQYDTIKRKNAKMNFAVAPLPQSDDGVKANVANYWILVVAKNKFDETSPDPQLKNKARVHEAWELLRYLTMAHGGQLTLTNAVTGSAKTVALPNDPAWDYVQKTKKPAARLDLIEKQKADTTLAPFATGNLIAKSWKQPKDPEEVEKVMAEAIDGVNIGKYTITEATRMIESRVGVLFGK